MGSWKKHWEAAGAVVALGVSPLLGNQQSPFATCLPHHLLLQLFPRAAVSGGNPPPHSLLPPSQDQNLGQICDLIKSLTLRS